MVEKKFVGKSFDVNTNWLAELAKVEQEKETTALIDEVALLRITKELERLKTEEAEFKAKLQGLMEANNTKSLKTKFFTITYVDEHETKTFDKKQFGLDHPKMAKQYEKKSNVKASVKITLRKKKGEE
jgi:uncharacterized protein YkuJ